MYIFKVARLNVLQAFFTELHVSFGLNLLRMYSVESVDELNKINLEKEFYNNILLKVKLIKSKVKFYFNDISDVFSQSIFKLT